MEHDSKTVDVPRIHSYQKTSAEVFIQSFAKAEVRKMQIPFNSSFSSIEIEWETCPSCGVLRNHMCGNFNDCEVWVLDMLNEVSKQISYTGISSIRVIRNESKSGGLESTACLQQEMYKKFEAHDEHVSRVVVLLDHPEDNHPSIEVRLPPIRKLITFNNKFNAILLSSQVGFQMHTSINVCYMVVELYNSPLGGLDMIDYFKFANLDNLDLDVGALLLDPLLEESLCCQDKIHQLLMKYEPHNCTHHDIAQIDEKEELFSNPLFYIPKAFRNLVFFPKNYEKLEKFLIATNIPVLNVVLDVEFTAHKFLIRELEGAPVLVARIDEQTYVYVRCYSEHQSGGVDGKKLPTVTPRRYKVPIENVYGREILSYEIANGGFVFRGMLILNKAD